jgi:hypothetical protein
LFSFLNHGKKAKYLPSAPIKVEIIMCRLVPKDERHIILQRIAGPMPAKEPNLSAPKNINGAKTLV